MIAGFAIVFIGLVFFLVVVGVIVFIIWRSRSRQNKGSAVDVEDYYVKSKEDKE